jgi:hypothetical protein
MINSTKNFLVKSILTNLKGKIIKISYKELNKIKSNTFKVDNNFDMFNDRISLYKMIGKKSKSIIMNLDNIHEIKCGNKNLYIG